jgi:hypothetical protein
VATSSARLAAAEKTAADLLPASTVLYVEVPNPGKIVDIALAHPLAKEIENHPDYRRALERPEYQRFQAALKLVEEKLGMKWQPALDSLTGGGLHVSFDLPTQGVAVLSKANDEPLAQKARDTILDLARAEAAGRGQADAIEEEQIHGIAVHKIGDVHVAALGKWLFASNKRLLVFMVLENYVSGGTTLAADEQFQAVLNERPAAPAAWMYLDLRVVRETGLMQGALSKKSDNPALELLAGGIIGALPEAHYVTASLEIEASRLKLTATLPCDPKAIAKRREFYVGPDGNGAAPPLLRPSGTLLTLSTYRDFASLWNHAPDLFDEAVNAKFAEAESGLTTVFAGRNFRDDILGNLEPGMQLVVTRQEFPQAGITPAVKLPAAAVVVRMKNPEDTTRIFKITFQSVVGFLNVAGAMNGASPLDLNSEKVDGALVVSTEYLPPEKDASRDEAGIHYNASPTVAFVGDRFILSSARPLALELAAAVERDAAATASINTDLAVDARLVQTVLADNRTSLVAQNMLEKGHDREAAEKEIDGLLQALKYLQSASVRLSADDKRLELTVEVVLANNP